MNLMSISKRTLSGLIGAFSATLFFGCQDPEGTKQVAPSVTELVEKIETSYTGGPKKEKTFSKNGNPTIPASRALRSRVERETREYLANFEKRFRTTASHFDGYDIGVIPAGHTLCPQGVEYVSFFMDNDQNSNAYSEGWTGAIQFIGGDTRLGFCRVDGRLFSDRGTYSVLKLGNNKPAAFETETLLTIDNDDDNNENGSTGDIYPNEVTKNTHLRIYTNTSNASNVPVGPEIGVAYGVFGSSALNPMWFGTHRSDDESDGNINEMSNVSGPNIITTTTDANGNINKYSIPAISTLTESQSETYFYVVRVR